MPQNLILIAEDEREIVEILSSYLERAGFRTISAADGALALMHFQQMKPDLVLLDVHMPKKDGVDVLRQIRQSSDVPVIMVTAMAEDIEKISALRLGADDYITKPFNVLEVVERVKTVLRRVEGVSASTQRVKTIGAMILDFNAHAVFVKHEAGRAAIALTSTEFAVLSHMAHAPQRVFSRPELVDACLPEGAALDRTVDSHVSNARRKLEAAGLHGFLGTVRGVGYRLEPLS